MSRPEHASTEPAPTGSGGLSVLTAFAEILRESLAAGSDREALEAMLAAIADALDYQALIVGRAEDEHILVMAAYGMGTRIYEAPFVRLAPGRGIASRAYATGEPVIVDDARTDPRWWDASDGATRSGVAIPMRLPDRVWGVLGAESEAIGAFDASDVAILQPLADQMAWALETMHLRDAATERAVREERSRRSLEATAAIITAGLEATEIDAALERMVREIRDQLGWDAMALLRLEAAGRLRVAAHYGFPIDVAERTYATSSGILGHVATTGRPYLASDTIDDAFYEDVVVSTRSELCVPLVYGGRIQGVLNAESRTPGAFTDEDLDVAVRIAGQMSLVLHNVELLASEKETVQQLHELDRLKSRLLTIASHELRTPLTVVLGFAEVLAEHHPTLPPDRIASYADAIVRQAGALSRLVDQMLLASQIEQGQLAVHPGDVEVLEVVAAALEGRDEQPIDVLPGVDGCRVWADRFRLGQVLDQLLDNAVKYAAEAGRIQIDARRIGDVVRILIRDEGPGIPPDEHERVFETFHQLGEHGVAGRRGVGLGLAVARDLLRLMGGDLQLASAEGYGATLLLELPTTEGSGTGPREAGQTAPIHV